MVTKTESGLQACYGKSPGKGAFSIAAICRRLVRLVSAAGLTAVSVEPLGAVARRGPVSRAGYEPLRNADANRPPTTLLPPACRHGALNRTHATRATRS